MQLLRFLDQVVILININSLSKTSRNESPDMV